MEYSQLAEKTDSIIKLITKWSESIYDFLEVRNENDISEFLEKGIRFYRDDEDSSIIMSDNNSTLMLFFDKKNNKSAIWEKYYYSNLLTLEQLNWAYKHYSSGCKIDHDDIVIARILEKSDSKSSLEALKDIIKKLKQTVNDDEVDTFFDAIEKTINNINNKYLNKKNKYLEDYLRDFETKDLKEQGEIINYYKIFLKAIEEGKKAGEKAGMSDKEIATFIAKRYLGIKNIEEYYAFIEYAKKCISQDSIISKYNFMYAIPESIDDTIQKIRSLTMKR